MIFFLFSYNRGPFLKNCVDSIERYAPADSRLVIYDDKSDDPETLAVLAQLRERHEVCIRHDKSAQSQHGSLYANMQQAIDSLVDDELIFFIQDDVQLIRAITNDDVAFIRAYFADNPRAGFLAPVFQKRITKQRTLDRFVFQPELNVYFCRHKSSVECAGVYYSDISLTTRARLRAADWQFMAGEYQNELQAKAHFHEMGYLYAPVAMQLPNAPAYRNKKKTYAFQWAEKFNRSGLYKFCEMSPASLQKLLSRPGAELPIAEDYLATEPELKKPWIFHPLKRRRLLRKLDKFENFLQKGRRPGG